LTDRSFSEADELSAILTELENLELPLLMWGVTNGSLAEIEVEQIIERHLDAWPLGTTCADVLEKLLSEAILFELPGTSPRQFRTRTGEAVRLAASLRQLFPPRDTPNVGWWQHRPTLVSDYRLHVATRRYPARNIETSAAIDELLGVAGFTESLVPIAEAVIRYPRLARFQLEAAKAVYAALQEGTARGIIVGAGTGSGKTLAFYLPAITAMADHVRSGNRGVHTIAIYPRNELLRDQFREAVARINDVNQLLASSGSRQIRVAALYGDTPFSANSGFHFGPGGSWRESGNGRVCPFMTCPQCRGDLVWTDADRKRRVDRLMCGNQQCSVVIDCIVLTREGIKADPPDLLFATTEMLNRNSTDPGIGAVLGWRSGHSPALVLLDEAHTYSGVHGAQVALLLRRWQHALKRRPVFVGLSATLRDAVDFFAQLVGIPAASVQHIEPAGEDLVEEGREYAIALRTDPLSQVSVLSTTIQTAMLFGRVLDPPGREKLFGSRGFIFTDDLDVTNRLFHDLADAEGNRRGGRVLAGLRSRDAHYRAERFADGQSWDLVHAIGRELDPAARAHGLRISLTSSQSSGVSQDSDLVVSTASLEVGFDDDRVGLVLQHKAPRDAASFIQRRGRAGRRRGTRPWTVVTLSDYGRDRFVYQSYDTLFAPELQPRRLPIGNRFVLKIQASHALLDWIAVRTGLDARSIVKAPSKSGRQGGATDDGVVVDLLVKLLEDETLQADLQSHLCAALCVRPEEAQAILWEAPRAILLGVVPTIIRRLERHWESYDYDPGSRPDTVLPEFVTQKLFDALNVPEVWFNIDFLDEPESRRIENALREAVPGKVSRRWGYKHQDHRTWLPVPASADGRVDVTSFLDEFREEGVWNPVGGAPIRVLRPYAIHLHQPEPEISDQSQGTPRWWCEFVETAPLIESYVPKALPWSRRVKSIAFGTGTVGNPVEVRRMTPGADCTVKWKSGAEQQISVDYVIDEKPVALGFSLTADAVRFELFGLDVEAPAVDRYMRSPQWRGFAFTNALLEDSSLDEHANVFQRRWIALVYTTALALLMVDDASVDAEQAHAQLQNGAWVDQVRTVLNAIYRSDSDESPARLVATLESLGRNPVVSCAVDRYGRLLWSDDVVSQSAALAQRTYRETVAAAIRAAVQRACPDSEDGDIIIDCLPAPEGETGVLWLTETSFGGLGVISSFLAYYAADPSGFWNLVDSAVDDCEHEYVRESITRLLDQVVNDQSADCAQAISRLRSAPTSADAERALKDLRHAWSRVDAPPRHAAVAALSSRYLRPGSDERTDRLALELDRAWDVLEGRVGFEIEAGILAYLVGTGRIDIPGIAELGFGPDQIYSLLVPRGALARTQHLVHYQPYSRSQLIDPLLVRAAHEERLPTIDVTVDSWIDMYASAARETPRLALVAPVDSIDRLARAVRRIPAVAVDRDVLRLYGSVARIVRSEGMVRAIVEVREAAS